jgi:hypothetical protein
MTELFLDTEFNGFGGKLISMALVPKDSSKPEFYREIEMKDQLEPWVRDNVIPHLFLPAVTYSKFQSDLAEYLKLIGECTIVADWPDDIRYFMEALITGPGNRITMPTKIDFKLDLTIDYDSDVPHNALHDARGIRKTYLGR